MLCIAIPNYQVRIFCLANLSLAMLKNGKERPLLEEVRIRFRGIVSIAFLSMASLHFCLTRFKALDNSKHPM